MQTKLVSIAFVILFTLIAMVGAIAQQQNASVAAAADEQEEESRTPRSPDGKFGFVTDYDSDVQTIDLIDVATKKVLQHIAKEETGNVTYSVRWADDSSRLALMTRMGHPNQELDVFFRDGNKFRKIKLPKLPDASIPEKMKHGKEFPHFAMNDWMQAEKWKKDGSLELSIETMIDGAGSSITASRKITLSFEKSGKAKIAKSTIEYQTEEE
jgi:hypothetical protein